MKVVLQTADGNTTGIVDVKAISIKSDDDNIPSVININEHNPNEVDIDCVSNKKKTLENGKTRFGHRSSIYWQWDD